MLHIRANNYEPWFQSYGQLSTQGEVAAAAVVMEEQDKDEGDEEGEGDELGEGDEVSQRLKGIRWVRGMRLVRVVGEEDLDF